MTSRLNDTIRFSVTCMNTLICLLGTITIAGGAYLVSATTSRFNSSTLAGWLTWLVVAGLVFLILSITGCCGTFHQTQRKGWCRGRRVLGVYQCGMLGVVVAFLFAVLAIRALLSNFKYLQAYPSSPLDHTERTMMSPYFNSAYYRAAENYVVGKDGFKWFAAWVHQECPSSMDVFSCTSCNANSAQTYSSSSCCPQQDLCDAGTEHACPYFRCRAQIAAYLTDKMRPWEGYIFIVILIQLVLIMNACLLICYNPRDTLSDLLTKTGIVMHKNTPPRPRRTPRSGTPNRNSRGRSPRSGQGSPRKSTRSPVPSVDLRGVQVDSPPRSPRSKPGPTPGGTSPQLLVTGAGGSVPSSPRRPNLMIDGRTTPRSGQGSSTSPPLTPNSPYSSNQHAMV